MDNFKFYDELSSEYDNMINFSGNLKTRTESLRIFIEDSKSAADIGCGTGLDSIALFKNNLSVDAFDPSEGMIVKAKLNAANYSSDINFYNLSIDKIPKEFENKYDLVVSMGNAIPNIEPKILLAGFKNIFSTLRVNGKFVCQILNYKRILMQKERIINIKEFNGKYFIRFYDFNETDLSFNVLAFEKENPGKHNIISTKIFPYRLEEINKMLIESDFNDVMFYGNLDKSEYDPLTSLNLVIEAKK